VLFTASGSLLPVSTTVFRSKDQAQLPCRCSFSVREFGFLELRLSLPIVCSDTLAASIEPEDPRSHFLKRHVPFSPLRAVLQPRFCVLIILALRVLQPQQ